MTFLRLFKTNKLGYLRPIRGFKFVSNAMQYLMCQCRAIIADAGPPVPGQCHVLAGTCVVCTYVSVHTLSAGKYWQILIFVPVF